MRRHPTLRRRQLSQWADAVRRTPQEQCITGHNDEIAVDIGEPATLSANRHDPHPRLNRQLMIRQRTMG